MRILVCVLFLTAMTLAATLGDADLQKRLSRWKPVDMPYEPAGLNPSRKQVVEKLVQAAQYIESAYWRQSDPEGLKLYQTTTDPLLKQLLFINGSRYDLLDDNHPFAGDEPYPPGRALYPRGLTREQIESYVEKHPDQKDALYNQYTVIRAKGDRLDAIPYHVEYRQWLEPAARLLREAAKLESDAAFAAFLQARADALLSDKYYDSDLLWVDLRDPKIDIIFAPYETYLDGVLGVKTSWGAAVLIRNEEESAKLALYQKYVPAIQRALPLDRADLPSKEGQPTPMEVVDAPFRVGDLLHGYQAVADNLPNDPRIHEKKGTKKIFFKNFMDARVNYVILPLAKQLMTPEQAAQASGAGYLAHTILHEISHGLGPAYSRVDGRQVPVTEAVGPIYSALEEAKADVVGMFGLQWLVENGAIPESELPVFYASYLAGNFRTMRYGVAEAHGRAEMMEFNYLCEQKAYVRDGGRWAFDADKMKPAIESLARELLETEATGDRARAEKWFAKYDKMPADVAQALDAVNGVPVDIEPKFSWPVQIR